LKYVWTTIKLLASDRRFDIVLCCHMNLVTISMLAKLRLRAPLLMFLYGIDAWTPQSWLKKTLLNYVDRFVSISDVTRRKFSSWSDVTSDRISILPNAIHSDW